MHPSHLDILWFNCMRELFSKEIARVVVGRGVNRFQNDHGMVIEGGGAKPQNLKVIAERRKNYQ